MPGESTENGAVQRSLVTLTSEARAQREALVRISKPAAPPVVSALCGRHGETPVEREQYRSEAVADVVHGAIAGAIG